MAMDPAPLGLNKETAGKRPPVGIRINIQVASAGSANKDPSQVFASKFVVPVVIAYSQ